MPCQGGKEDLSDIYIFLQKIINILGQPAIWKLNSNYFESGLKFVDFNPIVEFLTSKF